MSYCINDLLTLTLGVEMLYDLIINHSISGTGTDTTGTLTTPTPYGVGF